MTRYKYIQFVYLTIILSLLSCNTTVKKQSENKILFQAKNYRFPYHLQQAGNIKHLSKKLREISGLSYSPSEKLLAVQDEKAILFVLDKNKAKIIDQIHFGKDGDFEGVECVLNDAWIIKSNGDLYQIKDYQNEKKRQTIKHKTPLSKQNDVEGLAYNQQNHSLLIACKGYPFLKHQKNAKSFKTIYQFDLNTNKLIEKPYILIALDSLKKYKHYSKSDEMGIEIVSTIDEAEGDPTLQPSAIAIQPKTQNIYLLSSVGKILVVLSPEGKILCMQKLDHKLHKQPEGICFAPDGTLYISNEGKKSKANILSYIPE